MNAEGALYVAMQLVSFLSIEKGNELIMQTDRTVKIKNGWVFFYTSERCARTGIPEEEMINAGPVLVRRDGSSELLPAMIRWQNLIGDDGTM